MLWLFLKVPLGQRGTYKLGKKHRLRVRGPKRIGTTLVGFEETRFGNPSELTEPGGSEEPPLSDTRPPAP